MSVNDVSGTPRPTAGLDWASTDHVVAVVGPDGAELDRFGITHSKAGLATLCRRLAKAGVAEVAIERGDGPVVEALLGGGFTVFVPHSPMPFTGFAVTCKKSETVDLNISVDQAIQWVVSCGVVIPPPPIQSGILTGAPRRGERLQLSGASRNDG